MREPGSEQAHAAVDAHIAALDPPSRETLQALRQTLRTVLPHGQECIKYGMPTVTLHGKNVAHYGAFANHCSYFPANGSVLADLVEGGKYTTSKSGLQFDISSRLPVGLVRKLVTARLAELGDVHNGVRRE